VLSYYGEICKRQEACSQTSNSPLEDGADGRGAGQSNLFRFRPRPLWRGFGLGLYRLLCVTRRLVTRTRRWLLLRWLLLVRLFRDVRRFARVHAGPTASVIGAAARALLERAPDFYDALRRRGLLPTSLRLGAHAVCCIEVCSHYTVSIP
jgi:hypothetical protein